MAARKTKKLTAKKLDVKWSDLSLATRKRFTRQMISTYVKGVRLSAGRYNIVGSSKHTALRERAEIESGGEDDALTATLRAQFLNLSRNSVRNNEILNGILRQFETNVVGCTGGKACFDFGDGYEEAESTMREAFAKWASHCDYFDGLPLSEVLKIILKTVLLGGDLVAVFDQEMVENSGRLIVYEPDCIAEMKASEFKARYPNYVQRQGRVYTKGSRFAGVVVSAVERGRAIFDKADDCYVFMKDPNDDPADCLWTMIAHRWRINQGRGTPPLAAPLGSLMDAQAMQGFEIESAKKISQTYAQLIQIDPSQKDERDLIAEDDDAASTVYDEDDASSTASTDTSGEIDFGAEPVTFDELRTAGAMFDVMPANSKLEFADPKHPNLNMSEFIRQVQIRSGWALGVAAVFSTGQVESSYAGYRGEQLMSWENFYSWQKFLERALDWILVRWYEYARTYEGLKVDLPEDWRRRVKWSFPMMKEVNAVDAQNAWNLGLKNGSIGYETILGPDWKRILRERAAQIEFMKSINFPHPANETVSGQLITSTGKDEDTNKSAKETK